MTDNTTQPDQETEATEPTALWLSRKNAAARLGVSSKTLAQHLIDGPPMHKFFGVIRYHVEDLDAWALTQKVSR